VQTDKKRSANENVRGASWMTLSMAGYVINDAFIKLAAEELPLFESIFIRGCFITLWLTALAISRGELRGAIAHLDRSLGVRVAMEALGTALYLNALTRLPLAGITAVLQIVPLVVTFAAARMLRESVSWHRVASVVVGFLGVMLIIRPTSDDFNPWFLVGFLVVGAIVVREISTTSISTKIPSIVVSLTTAIVITSMGLVGVLFEQWTMPEQREILLLAVASVFLTIGYIASVVTIRTGDLSFSAPFRYTILVFAIILQIVFFDEVPDALTFTGAAIIAAAGIYTFGLERKPSTSAS